MADVLRLKYENPRMKQSDVANQLSLSSSTIQRHRNDINMLSPYRINPNNTNKRKKRLKILILTTIHSLTTTIKDLKRHQMTSKQLEQNLIRKIKMFQKPDLYKRILKLTNNI